MGCMCAECKYWEVVRNNHDELVNICVCRESENYLKNIDIAFCNCDHGKVDDEETEEQK